MKYNSEFVTKKFSIWKYNEQFEFILSFSIQIFMSTNVIWYWRFVESFQNFNMNERLNVIRYNFVIDNIRFLLIVDWFADCRKIDSTFCNWRLIISSNWFNNDVNCVENDTFTFTFVCDKSCLMCISNYDDFEICFIIIFDKTSLRFSNKLSNN